MHFADTVVVITGCGSGIGRGLAAGFCREGASVVGIGRTAADLEATATELGEGRMNYVVGDVARAEDVARLFDEAERLHARVDVLINNAAVYPKEQFIDGDIESWVDALEVNVVGMARCCHRALPGMLQRGHGRIINVGSFAWRNPILRSSAYSTSKAAVHTLTQSIAREVDRFRFPDVLVNEWLPGIFNTRMTPDAGEDPMTAYEGARVVAGLPPGGPHGEVFLRGRMLEDPVGLKLRVKRAVRRLLGS